MASKPCRRCGSTEKYKNGRCAPCERRKTITWRETHPGYTARYKHNPKTYKTHMARRYALICEHKAKPCADCGGHFPPCAMDFDHVRGEKSFGIGACSRRNFDAVLAEIAKCDVVCANCHRIRTWNRSHDWLEQV